jgi:prepilin-type N-terminal cleavage/methylation domain-containing protein
MTRRPQAGFTLIELMIVVAIIAILSAVMFGMSSRPYEANARVMSERLVSEMSLARTRAVATRRVHRLWIYNATDGEQIVTLDAASVTGMAYSVSTVWERVQVLRIPKSALIQSAVAGAVTTTGETPALDAGLDYKLYFKPDGSATASTVYVTDHNGTPHYYRALVYHATGSSYAREVW